MNTEDLADFLDEVSDGDGDLFMHSAAKLRSQAKRIAELELERDELAAYLVELPFVLSYNKALCTNNLGPLSARVKKEVASASSGALEALARRDARVAADALEDAYDLCDEEGCVEMMRRVADLRREAEGGK